MQSPHKLPSPPEGRIFSKIVYIHAPASVVWEALTNANIMSKWMSEDELDISTDWHVGGPITIRGKLHGMAFENKGTVLQFEREHVLEYNHLSSISRLRDKPENYSALEFKLARVEDQTALTVTVRNFPTENIYKHLAFYWNVTPEILKRMLENPNATSYRHGP